MAVAVMGGSLAIASPAQASGGGCSTVTQGGFNIGVCSGDDGVWMYPDHYINSKASGANDSNCHTQSRVEGSNGTVTNWSIGGCSTGHWDQPNWKIQGYSSSIGWRNRVEVIYNGTKVYDHYGPATHCC
jgi:hypothetical protein